MKKDLIIWKYTGTYKGKHQCRQIDAGRRSYSNSIDNRSNCDDLNCGDYFEGYIKPITPRNGNAPFDVVVITKKFKPRNTLIFKQVDWDSQELVLDQEYLDYDIEYYRKGGVKSYYFNGLKNKDVRISLNSVDWSNIIIDDDSKNAIIDIFKSEYDKYKTVTIGSVKEITEQYIKCDISKLHYHNSEYENSTIQLDIKYINNLVFKDGSIYFQYDVDGLKELFDSDDIYSPYSYYGVKIDTVLDTSWIKTNTTVEIHKKRSWELDGVFGISYYENVTIKSFSYNGGEYVDTYSNKRYTKSDADRYYKIDFISHDAIDILVSDFFDIELGCVKEIIRSTKALNCLYEANKELGLLMSLKREMASHDAKHQTIKGVYRQFDLDIDAPCDVLSSLMTRIINHYFPQIETHDFSAPIKFFTKHDNNLHIRYQKADTNRILYDDDIVALDLPCKTTSDYGSDWVTFKFYPNLDNTPNDIQYKIFKHRGSSSEHTRWGVISGSSRTREMREFEPHHLEHLGVENRDMFNSKFSDVYTKLNEVWLSLPQFSDISLFYNFLNWVDNTYSELCNETQLLMSQYDIEGKSSSGSSIGFWDAS